MAGELREIDAIGLGQRPQSIDGIALKHVLSRQETIEAVFCGQAMSTGRLCNRGEDRFVALTLFGPLLRAAMNLLLPP